MSALDDLLEEMRVSAENDETVCPEVVQVAADWWIRMEALKLADRPTSQRFRSDGWTYEWLLKDSTQPLLFEDDLDADNALPCACTE